jgi:ubiquinone/menaquinone biosynthesis C-methylase UbiE
MTAINYPWPRIPGATEAPAWSGKEFTIGAKRTPVLAYGDTESGWSDELTSFHEETAGENHPIDCASREHALEQLSRHLRPAGVPTILEVGCSSGYMLKAMRRRFPAAQIIGSDYIKAPLDELARHESGIPLLQFDLTQCPLPEASVDAVVMLNVLEHIADDNAALRQCRRILKPRGIVVIEVPAGPHLYDAYDRKLMHHRRYRLNELDKQVAAAGFEVLDRSHLGFFVYPAFRAVKLRNQRKPPSIEEDTRVVQTRIKDTGKSRVLRWAMQCELALGKRCSYPFGIRCLVTARKSSDR